MKKVISFVGSGALLTKAVRYSIDNRYSIEKIFCPVNDSAIPFLNKISCSYVEVPQKGLDFLIGKMAGHGFEAEAFFSINNRFLFSDKILHELNVPVINIHNGLVQSYRGVAEVCILAALCNCEKVYGATCHQILTGQEVDTGKVLLQKIFDVEENYYPWLMSRSIKNCQDAFEECLLKFFSEDNTSPLPVNFSGEIYNYSSILKGDIFSSNRLEKIDLGIYASIFTRLKEKVEKRKMKDRIIDVLGLVRPELEFTESDSFIEDGLLDSFDLISLVTYLDKEFGISIEGTDIVPENFRNLTTIEVMLDKYVSR